MNEFEIMSERTFDMAENLSVMPESKALSEIDKANSLAINYILSEFQFVEELSIKKNQDFGRP